MGRRSVSPARSENEFDIGALLFGGVEDNDMNYEAAGLLNNKTLSANNVERSLNVLGDESDIDDEAIIAQQQAASNRKGSNLKGRTVKKGGGFQAMGLNANLLKAITRKGFSVPTPIQRKTIPLLLNDKDVVGMARTGSGKTAAFIVPMIEKLKVHSTQIGARALILSPSRELALQTMQVVKELGRGTDLKTILLVGGDSLEEQFSSMSGNPDVIIATPGRFVHLKVEMGLDLSSIRYVVFDEADRLFEMGFAAQLTEILYALPASRQTLLFSATLPKSLVEFARAGLNDPVLVRLDADSKISPDLQSAFFTVKSSEKEGALLHLLQDVINVPTSSQLLSSVEQQNSDPNTKKRKRHELENRGNKEVTNPYSTIIFAATKHHVDYLASLLRTAGYAVSHVYGSLDQTARKMQVHAFRTGQTNLLVVTDVAARGIDIPVLANVINYDFPSQPKIYIHRVGRTARAGHKGWSYSIIHDADAPYLLDLQLFLGRKLSVGRARVEQVNFTEEVVVGSLQRDIMQTSCEWVNKNLESDADIAGLRSVATKGEKLYQRTRNSASAESAKRAKGLVASQGWTELHPLFNDESSNMEVEREKMLAKVGGFRPQESIFEIGARRAGRRGNEDAIDAMRKLRTSMEIKKQKSFHKSDIPSQMLEDEDIENPEDEMSMGNGGDAMSLASDSELEVTFSNNHPSHDGSSKKLRKTSHNFSSSATKDPSSTYRDNENFMSYLPTNINASEDRGYGVHSGTNQNFTSAARTATMDLGGDESGNKSFGESRSVMRWDKRHKKYVSRQNDEDGSKGTRLVRGESGAKIAASFRSGRYDAWRKANRIPRPPRVGETEERTTTTSSTNTSSSDFGGRFRHKKTQTAKTPDRYRDDYDKKMKKVRETREQAKEMGMSTAGRGGASDKGKRGGSAKIVNSVDDIRKERNLKQKRMEKNARPVHKGKGKPKGRGGRR